MADEDHPFSVHEVTFALDESGVNITVVDDQYREHRIAIDELPSNVEEVMSLAAGIALKSYEPGADHISEPGQADRDRKAQAFDTLMEGLSACEMRQTAGPSVHFTGNDKSIRRVADGYRMARQLQANQEQINHG